jgi:hypothetical protein
MKPSQIISLIVIFTITTTASVFFLRDTSNVSNNKSVPSPKVEFKWGEGSEAGVPDQRVNH